MMKRLVVLTVGKTHSGKTTFARALEKELNNACVVDQDNHAAFLNTFYEKLLPKHGPNTLKHALSQLIVDYAKEHSDCHFIVCNANRSKKGRAYLLEEVFPRKQFVRILVHFDLADKVLLERVRESNRSTNIFRGSYANFEEVLVRQLNESEQQDITDPTKEEADHLFVIKDSGDVDVVMKEIVRLAEGLGESDDQS